MKKIYENGIHKEEGSENPFIPNITFDEENGVVDIAGESYFGHSTAYFHFVFEWMDKYFQKPGQSITFNFKVTYFNTSSSKVFFRIFECLEDYQKQQQGKVCVNWYYQAGDVDLRENGEEYAEDLQIPFHLIEE